MSDSNLPSFTGKFKRLRKFVDRQIEYQNFDNLINEPVDDREKSILAFYGSTGMGKSMLLEKLEFECLKRDIPTIRIRLDEGGEIYSPTEIMRAIMKGLGEEQLAKWEAIYKQWTAPIETGNISQRGDINITGSDNQFFGDVKVENKVEVTSNAVLNSQDALRAYTETFLKILGEFIKVQSVVIILDGFDSDEFPESTRKWLSKYVLYKPLDLGGLGTFSIMASSAKPSFTNSSLTDASVSFELKPLAQEHILEYIQIRKIANKNINDLAEDCLKMTDGIPSLVNEFVEALLYSTGGD